MTVLLAVTAAFLGLLFVENRVAKRFGHFPTVSAIIVPFALLLAADDYTRGHYFNAGASILLAVVAVGLIRDFWAKRS